MSPATADRPIIRFPASGPATAVTPSTAVTPATAVAPAERRGVPRDGVRMLVARHAEPNGVQHRYFRDLPDELSAGDLVVVNTSATVAAELDATLLGEPVVIHLGAAFDDGSRVLEIRTAPNAATPVLGAMPGSEIIAGDVRLTLREAYRPSAHTAGNRLWRTDITGDIDRRLRTRGRPIACGYLDDRYPLADYQTIFSRDPGSSEMPSAARPFTTDVVLGLIAAGVTIAPITLHTGLSSLEVGEHPQAEWFRVPAATAAAVEDTRRRGGRVIAVGTTVTRALESAERDGRAIAAQGWTDRVIGPDAPARLVDGLITGWHEPEASHLLLVESIAGTALTRAAYRAAAEADYLWHEFGDSCLLLPDRRG